MHPITRTLSLAFIFFGILLMGSVAATTQGTGEPPFARQHKNWQQTLNYIDGVLKSSEDLDKTEVTKFRQRLLDTISGAEKYRSRHTTDLTTLKAQLEALGEAPKDGATEDADVAKQRKELTGKITAIDGDIKQANLVQVRSKDLLATIDKRKSEKVKELLLSRKNIPFSFTNLKSSANDFIDSLVDFDAWLKGLWVLLGMLAMAFCAWKAAKHMNVIIQRNTSVSRARPFTRLGLVVVGVIAYFVFLLRFGFISLAEYPALENMVNVVSSITLAVLLILSLIKIRFVDEEDDKHDDFGGKRSSYNWLWNMLINLVCIALVLAAVGAVLGYINFAQYFSVNILVTLLAVMMFFSLRSGVVYLNRLFSADSDKDKQKQLSPIAITVVEPVLAFVCLMIVLFFWGMTADDLEVLVSRYAEGIKIGDATIDLAGIISGMLLFVGIYYTTKLAQWFVSSRVFPYTTLDRGIKDAVIAITGYVGITAAILSAMGAVGLNTSNLAIVAGALSVGIGFGLQTIFNNFVSGLILLFERPVRVGDWIVVGEKQGHIKRIRVRSTEIETFEHSSVIVPNSMLISEMVTNWTLSNKVGRVDVAFGVAYGTDTDLVQEVVREVALAHPAVRGYPAPQILFMDFGDSSLNFELRCFIRNIAETYIVSSDLRYGIDKAFRKADIEIPFPQRDINFRNAGEIVVRQGASGQAAADTPQLPDEKAPAKDDSHMG